MLSQEIKSKALELGYTACGIIPSAEFKEFTGYVDERVKAFPKSKELYKRMYGIAKPPAGSKSIIVCIWGFNNYKIPENLEGVVGKFYLLNNTDPLQENGEVYDRFESYLKTLGMNILEGYIPDRLAAAKAGVGKFGRNNFIFTSEHGSINWVDTWSVDIELDYDPEPEDVYLSACNDKCLKCVEACPTKALSGGFMMDRGKCVAHISYRSEDLPPENIRAQLGSWLYGCDACQDACPVNKNKFAGAKEYPGLSEFGKYLDLERIMEMDQDTFTEIILPRLNYLGKDGIWLLKCNALRSMINSGQEKYHKTIIKYRNDPDARISGMAGWGCARLGI